MRVLVTGASGFIGRHVVQKLMADGMDVVAVARKAPLDIVATTWREVDLFDLGAIDDLMRSARPTHLIHLAWNATPGQFWQARDNLDWAAVTLRLFRAFIDAGGEGAHIAGSCAECDWTRSRLSEADVPRPATFYGQIKDATRAAVLAAASQFDVPCAWGRIFWLYGPHEPPGRLVSDVARALARGEFVACSEGTQRRDFMHVADVAGGLVAALRARWRGIINIGSGDPVAIRDVVAMVAEAAGRPDLIKYGVRPMPPGDPPEVAADVAILRDRIGFRPDHALKAGLAETFGWWKANI